jgi:flavin-dependent dehydrogenase
MADLKPVRIIGGGLAGLSLGIALRKAGVATEIFEAGDYPRHKVCGEFVTGLGEATIEKLGIGPAFAGAGSHSAVTWFLRGQAVGRQILPSPARAVSRFALDARLAGLFIAEGGKLVTRTRVRPPTDECGWVDAGGRKPSGSSPWMGLKLHARNLTTADGLELHLGDGAYVGLSSVEDGWINVCGLFRRRPGLRFDPDQAMSAHLRESGLHSLAERLAAAEIRPGSIGAVAGLAFTRRIALDDGVFLGDACAMIPPFTGDGMAMAFTSAALALDPLAAWARNEQSWDTAARNIREALRREFRLRLNSAALLHSFLLNRTRQRFLGAASQTGLLPLDLLYRLLH